MPCVSGVRPRMLACPRTKKPASRSPLAPRQTRAPRGWRMLALLALLVLVGCASDDPRAITGKGAVGSPCGGGVDCASGLCVDTELGGICTELCDPTQAVTCPAADNWRCAMAHQLERNVCLCQPDADHEICGDQRDNDCDRKVDDCMMCDGHAIAPDDERHCGACDRRCAQGATCSDGQCLCENGVASPDCVQDPESPECSTDKDCDDDITCTDDTCARGVCKHVVVGARCAAHEVCDLNKGGCTPGRACATSMDCHDEDPCTTNERCDPPTRVCLWDFLDGDDDGVAPRVCGGGDCNDADNRTYPGARELCDGHDNSCDGKVDAPVDSGMCEENQQCDKGKCVCKDTSLTTCGDDCVDPKTSAAHCGTCDNACSATQVCSNGSCVDANECKLGTDTCAEPFVCVDRAGGYDCQCPPGSTGPSGGPCTDIDECAAGADNCAPNACKNKDNGFTCECPTGYTGDGYTCTDVNECTSVTCSGHGDCVNLTGSYYCDCDAGYSATGGECVLTNACLAGTLTGYKWCDGACRNIKDDPNYCGGCTSQCGYNTACNNGQCGCNAGSGLTYCSGLKSCIDTNNDPSHCGGCQGTDTVCAVGGTCQNGDCGCPTGLTYCQADNVCTNLDSDPAHCGACQGTDAKCAVGGLCTNGDCGCPGGAVVCGNTCTTLGTNSDCASCGDVCPAGGFCGSVGSQRSCMCYEGQTNCSGTCFDLKNDIAHCGSCGASPCAVGATCNSGKCECPLNQSVCSGTCVDTQNNPAHCKSCGQTCAVACGATGCATATDLDARENLSCAVLSDGRVRCWGNSTGGGYYYYYSFGVGDYVGLSQRPLEALTVTNASKVAVGYYHACALTTTGDVYCWGYNSAGEISSANVSYHVLTPVLSATGYAMIVAGNGFTCGQKKDGSKQILCWGSDSYGVFGDGTSYFPSPSGPASLNNVSKLVAGANHVCALKSGRVYCWGYNGYGQVTGSESYVYEPREIDGLPTASDVATGTNHTCAVASGKVYCWGYGYDGQLGVGVSSAFSTPQEVLGISTAVSVYAGSGHTCAVLENKNIRCWGLGTSGQLGHGALETLYTPTALVSGGTNLNDLALGAAHTCARNASGEVLCWGNGGYNVYPTTFSTTTTVPTEISW